MIETLDLRIAITGLDNLGRLEVSLRGVGREAVPTEGRVEGVERATGRMAATTGRSVGVIDRMRRGLKSWAGQLLVVATAMLSVHSAVRSVTASTELFAGFERRMASVQAVSGATGASFQQLTGQAREMGRATEFTATQAAEAQVNLSRAGFAVNETLATTPAVLDLATAAELGLADASEIVAKTLRIFSKDAGQSRAVADDLALATARTNTDVTALFEGLKLGGPVAATLNQSFESTAAALGVLADAGLQASIGGTNLRGILAALASQTPKTRKVFRDLDVDLKRVNPTANNLADIIAHLAEKGVTGAAAFDVFGRRNAAAFAVLAGNIPKLRQLTAELERNKNTVAEMADIMRNTLAGSAAELRSALESVAIEVGQAMSPALREAASDWRDFLTASEPAARFLGEGLGAAIGVASNALLFLARHADDVTAVLVGLAAIPVAASIIKMGVAIQAAVVAAGGLGAAVAGAVNPITLAAVGVGALTVALVKLIQVDRDEQARLREVNKLLEDQRQGRDSLTSSIKGQTRELSKLVKALREAQALANEVRFADPFAVPDVAEGSGGFVAFTNGIDAVEKTLTRSQLVTKLAGAREEVGRLNEELGKVQQELEASRGFGESAKAIAALTAREQELSAAIDIREKRIRRGTTALQEAAQVDLAGARISEELAERLEREAAAQEDRAAAAGEASREILAALKAEQSEALQLARTLERDLGNAARDVEKSLTEFRDRGLTAAARETKEWRENLERLRAALGPVREAIVSAQSATLRAADAAIREAQATKEGAAAARAVEKIEAEREKVLRLLDALLADVTDRERLLAETREQSGRVEADIIDRQYKRVAAIAESITVIEGEARATLQGAAALERYRRDVELARIERETFNQVLAETGNADFARGVAERARGAQERLFAAQDVVAAQDAMNARLERTSETLRTVADLFGEVDEGLGQTAEQLVSIVDRFLQAAQAMRAAAAAQQAAALAGGAGAAGSAGSAGTAALAALGVVGAFIAVAALVVDLVRTSRERERQRRFEWATEIGYGDRIAETGGVGQGQGGAYFPGRPTATDPRDVDAGNEPANFRALWDGLRNAIDEFRVALGGILNFMPGLVLEIRRDGEQIRVTVGGALVGVFTDMQLAIEEGLRVALAQADFGELGANVARALELLGTSSGITADYLLELLPVLQGLDLVAAGASAAVAKAAVEWRAFFTARDIEAERLLELGVPLDQVLERRRAEIALAVEQARAQGLALAGISDLTGGLAEWIASVEGLAIAATDEAARQQNLEEAALAAAAALGGGGGSGGPGLGGRLRGLGEDADFALGPVVAMGQAVVDFGDEAVEAVPPLADAAAAAARVSEEFIALVREIKRTEILRNVYQDLADWQEKTGQELIKNDELRRRIEEADFRLFQLRFQQTALEIIAAQELLGLTAAEVAELQGLAAAVAAMDFSDIRPPRGAGGGAGGRREERERFAEELERLELQASSLATSTVELIASFAAFEEGLAAARAAGVAEEDLARARRANAAIVRRDFLAGYQASASAAGETGYQTELRLFMETFTTALQDAFVIATEAARANGTTVAAEFASIVAVMGEGFQAQFQGLAGELIDSFVGEGDVAGLLAFRDTLLALDVPPELRAFFESILPGLLADVDAALAAIGEQSIDDLGLPLEGLRDGLEALGTSLANLEASVAEGAIAAERAAQIFLEAGAKAFSDLGGQALDFFGRYFGEVQGFEELRRRLDQARFDLELAQLELQLSMLSDLGLLTEEQQAMIRGVLDYARENAPDFTADGGGGNADPLSILLPSSFDQTFRQAQSLADALQALGEQFAAGEIGAWRYAKTLELASLQAFTTLGDQVLGFVQRYYGEVEGFEGIRMQLEQARFVLEYANMQLQFQLIRDLGILTAAQIATIEGALQWIAENAPTFPTGPGAGGRVPPPRHRPPNEVPSPVDTSELDRVRERIAAQVETWNEIRLDPVDRELRQLAKTFEGLRDELLAAGGSAEELQELEAALAIARQDVIDRQLDPVREALAGLRTEDPRQTGSERFADLQARFLTAVARVNAGDLSAAREAADLGRQLEQLGRTQFGTAGSAYDDLRDLIEGQLAGLVGEDASEELGLQRDQLGVQAASLDVLKGIHAALAPDSRRGAFEVPQLSQQGPLQIVVEFPTSTSNPERKAAAASKEEARRREREKSEERRRQEALYAEAKETNRLLARLLARIEEGRPAGGGKSA